MKLQYGKRYVRRDGIVTNLLRESGNFHYPFTDGITTWKIDGLYADGLWDHSINLIREYTDPSEVKTDSNKPIGIEALVCADIAARQQVGIKKYGTTLGDNPLTTLQTLQHAYEESLDFPIYLKKLIVDMTEKQQTTNETK